MTPKQLIVLTTLLGALLVAGCGQRGPLYIPSPDQPKAKELPPVVPKRKSDLRS